MGRKTSRRAQSARETARRRPAQANQSESISAIEPVGETVTTSKAGSPPGDDPSSSPDPDQDQGKVEDDLIPGVEYNVVPSAPPGEIIPALGYVISIERGREDLPTKDAPEPMIDSEFLEYCTREGDDRISLEEVLEATSRIPGSMAQTIIDERADRF